MGIKTDSMMKGAEAGSAFGPVGTAIGAGLGFMQGGKEQAGMQTGSMLDAYRNGLREINDDRNEALRMDDSDERAIMDSFKAGWGIY